MNKVFILPKLAVTGIRKNGIVYIPYILTTSFAICVFFIFSCIIKNQMLNEIPYAGYALMLLEIGKWLLGIIIIPFLFYTNSFLIKRRKREIGLYSILGLEKKHIGIMMFFETILIYIISIVIGLSVATVFAKLVFLILLNIGGFPIETKFTMPVGSFIQTILFFAVISALNLITNLFQVTTANPSELLSGTKKGEKEPKHIWIATFIGIVTLGYGYYLAFSSKMDSMIFMNFFLAVLLVVIGTYFLFTSGSITLLKILKKNKKFYYKEKNYITISGMLYRMKKSSASLVNICIFSTMIIITMLCTVSLSFGEADAIRFHFPKDAVYVFDGSGIADIDGFHVMKQELADKNNVKIEDQIEFSYYMITMTNNENKFIKDEVEYFDGGEVVIRILSLEDYNKSEAQNLTLENGEVLLFSNTFDYNYSNIILNDNEYQVKQVLKEVSFDNKEKNNYGQSGIYIVVKETEQMKEMAIACNKDAVTPLHTIRFNVSGEEADRELFLDSLDEKSASMPGFASSENVIAWGQEMSSMNGGLLFIGIFFGMLFTICLVLIMYYKQISEGLEDKKNFEIMQQVGMSDDDVKMTIHRQIMMVFGLPLVAAIIHTFVSLNMTICLLYALDLFNTNFIIFCAFGTIVVFGVVYGISYLLTAKTYYKIVKAVR